MEKFARPAFDPASEACHIIDRMRLSRRLAIVVIAVFAASPLLGSERSKSSVTYRDEECGFHFQYPTGWLVEKNEACDLTITPRDLAERLKNDDVDVWSFDVTIHEGTLLAEAADAGFDFQHGHWVLGGFGFLSGGEAEPFEMPPWWGLRGSSSVRCYHPHGGNAGFCRAFTVIAQSKTVRSGDSRVVRIQGFRQSRSAIDSVLRTFRFDLNER